jgi:hypothetical protein
MSKNQADKEIYRLLYLDENGNEIDPSCFDRIIVQVDERIESIKLLLKHEKNLIRLDAAVLLTRWGVEEGIDYLEDFVDRDAIDDEGEYSCRNSIDDCTYDIFGRCLVNLFEEKPEKSSRAILLLKKIISFFGKRHFCFETTSALLHSNLSVHLIDDFEKAMDSCINNNDICEASTLIKLYVKWGGERVLKKTVVYIDLFLSYSDSTLPKIRVAELLSYLPPDIAISFVPILQAVSDVAVQHYLNKFLRSIQKKSQHQ